MPRTKSSLVYNVIRTYYAKKFPNKFSFLDQFFNKYHYQHFLVDVIGTFGQAVFKKRFHEPKPNSYVMKPVVSNGYVDLVRDYSARELMANFELDDEVTRRLELVKTYTGRNYLFKIHPIPLATEVLTWLENNYTYVTINVENKLDQFLRYAIEMETDVWGYFPDPNIPAPLPPTPKSIRIDYKFMSSWASRVKASDEYLESIKDKIVLKHSDILAMENRFEILDLLGFSDWKDIITEEDKWKIPSDRPLEDSLQYFINTDEINEWAHELGLTTNKPEKIVIAPNPIEVQLHPVEREQSGPVVKQYLSDLPKNERNAILKKLKAKNEQTDNNTETAADPKSDA
jgi:hypothetical protein